MPDEAVCAVAPPTVAEDNAYFQFDERTGFSKKAGFQLKPKQIEAVLDLVQWPKSLNKLEVGCGKTVVSTAVSLMQGYEVTVVTVPPILITGWVKWLNQVSSGVVEYRGLPKHRKRLQEQFESCRWIVCSHAIFRDDFEVIETALKRRWLEVIVDEAHFLKNSKSKLFKLVQKLTAGNRGCQMLTGTPISKPLDSYAYIKLKTPEIYKSRTAFEACHVAERDFFKNPIKYANLDILKERLDLRSVSGTKTEVHGYSLKPLTVPAEYELDPAHQRLYEQLVNERLLEFDNGTIIDASTAQKLRQALQQVVLNWAYFADDETVRPKFFDLLDLTLEEVEVDKLTSSKLIIWTKYKRSSKRVWDYCLAAGIPTVAAYGDTDSEKAVQAFMNDEKTRILVAQPQSCGAGLNPQHVCNEMLFAEIDTVPIYARQAFGRIDRVGQTKTPRIKIATALGTVQVGLLRDLLSNDDLVQQIEPTKKSVRDMLLGRD